MDNANPGRFLTSAIPITLVLLATLIALLVTSIFRHGESADHDPATNYLLAILELGRDLPDCVHLATSDDGEFGYGNRLSEKQVYILRQPAVVSSLSRFDYSSAQPDCDWGRYESSSWSDAEINNRFHSFARVVLLRARAHYEAGEWIDGNRDVERVRILARRMAQQARPFEHQCFMVENMANATAAAYLLEFPREALDDLSTRHFRLGSFSPKKQMLHAEAERILAAINAYENGQVTVAQLLQHYSPWLSSNESIQTFSNNSNKEVVTKLRELSIFLKELSTSMDRDLHEAKKQIMELYDRYAASNPFIEGYGETPNGEYLENAQGICRGLMVGAVIERLRQGQNDFSNIQDPYGQANLKYRAETPGFTLVSELHYFGNIDFRFGLAQPNR